MYCRGDCAARAFETNHQYSAAHGVTTHPHEFRESRLAEHLSLALGIDHVQHGRMWAGGAPKRGLAPAGRRAAWQHQMLLPIHRHVRAGHSARGQRRQVHIPHAWLRRVMAPPHKCPASASGAAIIRQAGALLKHARDTRIMLVCAALHVHRLGWPRRLGRARIAVLALQLRERGILLLVYDLLCDGEEWHWSVRAVGCSAAHGLRMFIDTHTPTHHMPRDMPLVSLPPPLHPPIVQRRRRGDMCRVGDRRVVSCCCGRDDGCGRRCGSC